MDTFVYVEYTLDTFSLTLYIYLYIFYEKQIIFTYDHFFDYLIYLSRLFFVYFF